MWQLKNNVVDIIVVFVMTKMCLKENWKLTFKKKMTEIAPNHKFVSEGFTVCNLSLDPQKQLFSELYSKSATTQNKIQSGQIHSNVENVYDQYPLMKLQCVQHSAPIYLKLPVGKEKSFVIFDFRNVCLFSPLNIVYF